MKAEDVISGLVMIRHNFCQVSKDRATIHKAIEIIESTRWRKLSEEKPLKEGYYEIGVWVGWPRRWYSTQGKFGDGRFAVGFTHWRPIISPEEES